MKHLFILNPAAGKYNQTVEFTEKITAVCKPRGLDYAVQVSSHKGNCTELARAAAQSGEDCRIYACGGDGTLNEVVCGVAGFDNVAVTHFPGGSGNDFIRIFSDPAAFRDLNRLMDCDEAQFDLIAVGNKTYCLNICSMGIDARVAADMTKYKRLPGLSGSGAYILSTVANTLKGVHSPFEVTVNGRTICGEQSLICVCNGRYYGGGFHPVPEAEPDDGLLDVLLVRGVSRMAVARIIGDYKAGNYKRYPDVITHYRVPEISIRSPRTAVINVDGEAAWAQEVTFSVAPHKLRFFYPKGLRYRANL